MSTNRVVLFNEDDEPVLLLRNVKRFKDGRARSGDVVNGAWHFEEKNGKHYVDGRHSYPARKMGQFEVPDDWDGDHNEIMERARKEYRS